ncbi:2-keto-3-deoxygluconate kinase [Ahniella affigens]|uniref:2-keto-3-deoxygluconate kinase n=1 Tax=Ahniella affigens TaxID=2021234 RepID=A0A2P1PTU4_9GAMM|nr:sugar kinase [Ahniella affigens]AVP98264.1 2-keto-3-deoxygluconate kinase [Ahniella affigens]
MSRAILCFGELLIRLAPPARTRLAQAAQLDLQVGGAEANVAAGLAQFGHVVQMLSVLPDHALGDLVLAALRAKGVDTDPIRRQPGRMGLYFLEQGAMRRASEVLYDRAGSVFAAIDPAEFDWPSLLRNVGHVHLSGVTPALNARAAQCAIEAAQAARRLGCSLSMDGNFRGSLWKVWNGDAPALLRSMMQEANVLFASQRDIELVLGARFDTTDSADQQFRKAAVTAFQAFPHLQQFTCTHRVVLSAGRQQLAGLLALRDGTILQSAPYTLDDIVDRIGAGDAFASGFLHGLLQGWPMQRCLDFALAAGAHKHSVPGDMPVASERDIEAWIQAEQADVKR